MPNKEEKATPPANEELKFFYKDINHDRFIKYLSLQVRALNTFQKHIETINTKLQKSESVYSEAINKKIREGNVSPNFKHPKHDTLTSENFISEYLQYISDYKAVVSSYIDSSSIYIDTMKKYFKLPKEDQKEIGKHVENHKALKDHLSPEKYQKLTILFQIKSFLGKEIERFFLVNNLIADVSSETGKAEYDYAVAQVRQNYAVAQVRQKLNMSNGNANLLQAPHIISGNVLQNPTGTHKQNPIADLLKEDGSKKTDTKHQNKPLPQSQSLSLA